MLVIRPIAMHDLDQLVELAALAGVGITTLPKDRELLRKRITESEQGFGKMTDKPAGETYLFVLEDLDKKQLVGTSGIVAKVGGFEPFYAYRIETSVHESQMLGVHKEIQTLHLVREHNGPCEIGSLFLAPDYRRGGTGRLLSLSRFLFIAQFPDFFAPRVIAEMRGVIDEDGRSAMWEALGKHFFEIEYPTADYLSMVNKKFIADLMPTHPIYIPMLPKPAQDVIGQVHANTRPALHLLESEGFQFSGMVDIFEAGPVMICPRDEIRAVRDSHTAVIRQLTDDPIAPDSNDQYVISNTSRDFRAIKGNLLLADDGTVTIQKNLAAAVNLNTGDTLRYTTIKPPVTTPEASP